MSQTNHPRVFAWEDICLLIYRYTPSFHNFYFFFFFCLARLFLPRISDLRLSAGICSAISIYGQDPFFTSGVDIS